MTGKNVLLAAMIIMLVMAAGLDVNFYDRGRVKQKTTREYVNTTVRIEIWDQDTGGAKLYTKDGTATNGRWNIAVGPVELEYGKQYWKEYTIGGEDADFNGEERQPFYALHGGIKTGYLITDTSADLVVDTTNHRVGIAMTPTKTLDVGGTLGVSGATTLGATLGVTGAATFSNTITVGVDDTGYDVKFYGATASKSMLWDENANKLIVTGDASVSGTATIATADINGGTIDGVAIGSTTDATALEVTSSSPVTLSSSNAAATAITLSATHASGGVKIEATTAAAATSINLVSTAGGITIDSGTDDDITLTPGDDVVIGANKVTMDGATGNTAIAGTLSVATGKTFSSDTVDIDGGAIDGVAIGSTTDATALEVTSSSPVTLSSSNAAATAITLSATHASGGVKIEATTAAAATSINLVSTAGGITLSAGTVTVSGNIAVSGTVDGRDIAADGTKLDNIEALADVTDATNVDAAGAVMEADFNAQTVLAATADNTPAALTVGEQTLVGRKTSGNVAALAKADVLTIINVEDGADVTDATNVAAAGAVMDADFAAADQIMVGSGAGTHSQLAVGEQALVGRITAGNIAALTATQVRTLLNVEDAADVTDATNVDAAGAVMEADFNAQTVLAATADNTPAALTVGEQTLVGRKTSGNVAALAKADVLTIINVEDGADVTDATNVAAAGAVMDADFAAADQIMVGSGAGTHSQLAVGEQALVGRITAGNIAALTATQVRTLLNVEDAADVTDATNVDAAGAVMEADFNAQTVLAATADNTPAALTVGEQTLVGRKTSGNVAALAKADVLTIINVEDGADVTDATNVDAAGAVMEADFNAQTVLAATADNTPAALTVGEQTLVGRKTSGNVAALSVAEVKTLLGLGTIATQDADSVTISGGALNGVTIGSGGADASTLEVTSTADVTLSSSSAAATAITLSATHASGGVKIEATTAAAATSINLVSTAGGITLDAATSGKVVHVKNLLKLNPLATASRPGCTSALDGSVYFDDTLNIPCYCDGGTTSWLKFSNDLACT